MFLGYATDSISMQAEKNINIKAGEKISMQAGKGMDVKTKEEIQIKTDADFKWEGKNIHAKAGTDAKITAGGKLDLKGKTAKIGGGDSVDIFSGQNNATPDFVSGGSAPSSASESKPKDTPNSKSTALGVPRKRKQINKHKAKTDNPDAGIADQSNSVYNQLEGT